MRRSATTGACAGALLGTLFALAVISFADCAGPACGRERVIGVAGHALAGGGAGAVLGVILSLIARLWKR